MPLVVPQVANGLKGGEVGIYDVEPPLNILNGFGLALGARLTIEFLAFRLLLSTPKGYCGLDPSRCPLEALDFSCIAISDVFVYNGFSCMLNVVHKCFNILLHSESSKVVSPLSPGRYSDMNCNGFSSHSSNINLRSLSNIGFEKSFLVPVASQWLFEYLLGFCS
eukprot:Gb_23904 [translate_table: standard]